MAQFVSGSIFVNVMTKSDDGGHTQRGLLQDEVIKGHKHHFDHTSIFFNGKWRVKRWNTSDVLAEEFEREAPFHLLIDKDCLHEFTFLGGAPEGIAWCVYSHRRPDGEVINEWNGWTYANSPRRA